jgi:hypothetical protein
LRRGPVAGSCAETVRVDHRRRIAMNGDGVATLQGFAWYVRRRPGVELPSTGGHPLDGVDSKCRPLCWPIGPDETGASNPDFSPMEWHRAA